LVTWPSGSVIAAPIAILATLRAAYFVHEIAHSRHVLPGFELAWNLVVGVWVLLPSFMADAHVDHHRVATYGTARDPEYEPVATWSRWELVKSIAVLAIVPPLLVVRFGVIGPCAWLIPALRRIAWQRLSTLQTNREYVRSLVGMSSARAIAFELAATAALATLTIAISTGVLPLRVAFIWWAVTGAALMLNQARTLLAHGYVPIARARTLSEQVADTRTALRTAAWLVYPVGTRYHAVHHLVPSLPYHALAAADRQLRGQRVLARPDHAGLSDGLVMLWRRAARR